MDLAMNHYQVKQDDAINIEKYPQNLIAKLLSVSRSSVIKYIDIHEGRKGKDKKTLRKKKLMKQEVYYALQYVLKNPFCGFKEIIESLDLKVSVNTLRTALNENGLKSYVASEKPFANIHSSTSNNNKSSNNNNVNNLNIETSRGEDQTMITEYGDYLISTMNSISPSYLHPIGGPSYPVAHHFNCLQHATHHNSSSFSSSSLPLNLQHPSSGQNQYSNLNHHNNLSSSTFSTNSFQLNLSSPLDQKSYPSSQRFLHNSLGINHSSSNLNTHSLMSNESFNCSGESSLSSSSPVSITSSSPEAKSNFYPNFNPNYVKYINKNCSFNNLSKTQYEDDDFMIRDDEEDDLSVSPYDIKYTPNGIGYEPLPDSRRAKQKPELTEPNMKLRLKFAQKMLQNLEMLDNIVFTDETTIQPYSNGVQLVKRQKKESMEPR
ncbi:hypothetical protein RND71_043678 [Anisodus tanguticus]|uniref:Uncharacterized protein n=1 Tax=Anisodus tanguticus TaxID=243964 RepID=A0AAE1QR58_9SOLA|nr:hypothetical protein RND71_043678 [Anisodus tanguticus]